MKTIHIYNYNPGYLSQFFGSVNRLTSYDMADNSYHYKNLILDLYKKILVADPKFHYLIEDDLLIRVKSTDVISSLKKYLTDSAISFEEYSYPKPENTHIVTKKVIKCYGESDQNVLDNLNMFIKLLKISN